MAHGVADGEHGDVVRGAEAVEPVAADPVVAVRGQVAAGQLQPAGRGQLRQHRPLQRLGDAAALLQQPLGAPPLTGRDVGGLRGARRHDPQLQLRRAGAGQVGEHGQVGLGPPARLVVDGAQRADHPAVGVGQRHARVGDDLQLRNGEVAPHQGVAARVLDDEGLGGGDHVLAERVAQRGATLALVRLGQAGRAGEHLLLGAHQGHQGHRHRQLVTDQPHEPLERLVRRGRQQGPGRQREQGRRRLARGGSRRCGA